MALTLLKGDCLEVMAGLPDKSIDCFICDLPYGCLIGGAGAEKAKRKENGDSVIAGCAWDIALDLDAFWKQIRRLRKDDHTPCLMFCTTKFGFELYNSNPKEFRYDLVWDKQRGVSFLTANKMPMRSHEMIYVFSKAGAYYNRVDIDDITKKERIVSKYKYNKNEITSNAFVPGSGTIMSDMPEGKRCVLSVIQNLTSPIKGKHPTEKPEALYRFLIERYCPATGTLLDPTAGSFNSCFTAVTMGRKAIGIEKDDGFFEKAKKRAEG
jgi:site-specific DNA-methyltransferase (adenine-specific)